MKPGEIANSLRRTNLWWRGSDWESRDPDLVAAADVSFRYEPRPLADLREGGLYVLRGPRRVGKTLEMKRAVSALVGSGVDPRRVIHASVEGWRDADLGGLVDVARRSETRDIAAPRYWFIDEITGVVGDWPNRLKWLRDNDHGFRQDTVVVTGSSARGLDRVEKALAGRRGPARHSDRTLLPMGFADFCRATGLHELPYPAEPIAVRRLRSRRVDRLIFDMQPWIDELVMAWENYLECGGFPTAVDDRLRHGDVGEEFRNALWSVVHGEAVRSARFSATQTSALLALLVEGLSSPLNVAHAARELGVAHETAVERLTDLQVAFMIWPCHQEAGLLPRLRAQAKAYFTDPAVARLLSWRSESAPRPDLTKLSEQQLGMAIMRHVERTEPGAFPSFDRVLFHRASTRSEIDFVGPDFGGVAIESRYVDDRWGRAAQTLRASQWSGIVATRSIVDLTGDVWALPAPVVALLLDP